MAVSLLKALCTSAISPGALAETGELQEADCCVLDGVRQHLTTEDPEEACLYLKAATQRLKGSLTVLLEQYFLVKWKN